MSSRPILDRVGEALRPRAGLLALGALVGAQLALTATGLGGWPCPLKAATDIPCPGCGLTRATLALARGDLSGSLALHPLAPAFALAGIAGFGLALAPESLRRRAVAAVPRAFWTAAAIVAAVVVMATWLARLPWAFGSPGHALLH